MRIGYTAVERFDKDHESGEGGWDKYIEFSKIAHSNEIVSLDGLLCPSFIKGGPSDEDWKHLFKEDLHDKDIFDDLNYLLKRVSGSNDFQILAVAKEPTEEEVRGFTADGFLLKGYDLIENGGTISALTNCGGFDDIFSPLELSPCGLLEDHKRAFQVKELLKELHPEEPHAHCVVWAIWRLEK